MDGGPIVRGRGRLRKTISKTSNKDLEVNGLSIEMVHDKISVPFDTGKLFPLVGNGLCFCCSWDSGFFIKKHVYCMQGRNASIEKT